MGISIWQLLIILVIVVVLFGTKKLRNIGGDLGGAIKNFRQSLRDGEEESATKPETTAAKPETAATPESAAKPETATTPQPAAQMTQEDKGKIIEGQVTDKQTSKV
ncbi:MAG: twin-arginine translocase TatA/TatE family subunit [Candidatus Parabeggiatoa sp.]|nr:twin-arginine translocase TatA/TatE family subunit [Candidatus Parabeggiatoa sp.]